MVANDAFKRIYPTLPAAALDALNDLWMTGVNHSGVYVRFRDVEATIGKIVEAIREEVNNEL